MKRAFAIALLSMLLVSVLAGTLLVNLANANWIPIRVSPPYVQPPPTVPTLSVSAPANKTYCVNATPLSFTATVSGQANTEIDSVVYSLDGINTTKSYGSYASSVEISTTLTGLSEDPHSMVISVSCRSYVTYTSVWGLGYSGKIALESGIAYSESVWSSSDTIHFAVDDPSTPRISILYLENNIFDSTNVPLYFELHGSSSWLGYSLDGQPAITITGNTTLTGLSAGTHNVKVYAIDTIGHGGWSKTVTFEVATQENAQAQQSESFPTMWIAAAIVTAVVVIAGLIFYLRKRKHSRSAEAT